MKNQKSRAIALALALAFVLSVICVLCLSNHECQGEDCQICDAVLHWSRTRTTFLNLVLVGFVLFGLCHGCLDSRSFAVFGSAFSLIKMKTKLTD